MSEDIKTETVREEMKLTIGVDKEGKVFFESQGLNSNLEILGLAHLMEVKAKELSCLLTGGTSTKTADLLNKLVTALTVPVKEQE